MTKKRDDKEKHMAQPTVDTEQNTENQNIDNKNLQEATIEPNEASPESDIDSKAKITGLEAEMAELKANLAGANDKYLRLSADFDNFRRRTLKEKMELINSASEKVLSNILSVIDDFERAIQASNNSTDAEATKEGILLIYNKFKDFTKQNGVTEIDAIGADFNTDMHEAITKIPAPTEELKGKVVDVIQKGYYLNDKVIRFAKVVVGE